MPKLSPEKLLATAIDRLRTERATLLSRVSEIDASFGRLGIALAGSAPTAAKTGKRLGRPPGTKNSSKKSPVIVKPAKAAKPAKAVKAAGKPAPKKRKRGSFAVTGDESILAFVASAGQPNAIEVNAHWQKEGRGGRADTALGLLVKAGKLKRVVVEGERGLRLREVLDFVLPLRDTALPWPEHYVRHHFEAVKKIVSPSSAPTSASRHHGFSAREVVV